MLGSCAPRNLFPARRNKCENSRIGTKGDAIRFRRDEEKNLRREKKMKKGKKLSVERDRYVRIQLRRILALSLKFKTARVDRYQPLSPSFFPP